MDIYTSPRPADNGLPYIEDFKQKKNLVAKNALEDVTDSIFPIA